MEAELALKSSAEFKRERAAVLQEEACLMCRPLTSTKISGEEGDDAGCGAHMVLLALSFNAGDIARGTQV